MALIHAKTAAGRREIEDRGLRLAPALRSVLLLVDGQRDSRELQQMAQGLRAPEDVLEQLLALELIEVVEATRSARRRCRSPCSWATIRCATSNCATGWPSRYADTSA